MTTPLQLPPLSLYVHIPWCVRKCPYCDFNSHEGGTALPETDYVRALIEDLDQDKEFIQGRALQSIFFGGGTPSLFSPAAFSRLLEDIGQRIPVSPATEITMEANPGTLERERFAGFRQAGINRLSIGVQSFDDAQLQRLGRIHDSGQALRAIDEAERAGFDNINIDIMYGLPGQSTKEAVTDLETALARSPAHLSWYQLTIEPNTVFYRRPPVLPEEDTLIDMQEAGLSALESAGYRRYEVSAFARPGAASLHNLNYWRFGDYLGIGAGAHGKITLPDIGEIMRTRKHRQPDHYLAASLSRLAARAAIPRDEVALEFMMNALRLPEGFTMAQFEAHTGLPFGQVEKQVESLLTRQLLERDGSHYRPTREGFQFLNTVLEAFL